MILYIMYVCMLAISAKYVWWQNKEIKPDLTIWPSETSRVKRRVR